MAFIQRDLVYVIGIDGGGTTGYGIIGVTRASIFGDAPHEIKHWKTGSVTGNYTRQVLNLRAIISTYYDPFYSLAIAAESFSPRKPIQTEEFLSPVYINARLQFLRDTGRIKAPLFYQTPSQAMETASDARLKQWGLYQPGPDHPKDGTRHAITFIRRAMEDTSRALARQAWPVPPAQASHKIRQYL
jgi:hypothetical protein